MITIPNELKPTLNTLIRYYRKHSDDPSYQAKNFVLDKNGIEICDVSTLSKLENNKIQCMDDIYFGLLEKLDYAIEYNVIINEMIHTSNQKLLTHAEINDVSKILAVLQKVMDLLSSYKHCILYKEYYEIYELMYLYYKEQKFNKDQIDKYIELYDLIAEELRPIFISVAYHYYSRVNIDMSKILNLLNQSIYLKKDTIIKHYLVSTFYLRNNQLIELRKYSISGIEKCKKQNNKYYLVRFYNLLALIHRFDDTKKSIYYLTLCIANFDKNNDSYETLSAFYHNMAQIAYDKKEYTNILYIYKKHLYDDIQFLKIFFYLLINTIQATTQEYNEITRILLIIEDNISELSDFHKTIFNLFEVIYKKQPIDNFYKIVDELQYFHTYFINEPLLKMVILDEIKEYCIMNNIYSFYQNVSKYFH